MSVHSVSKLVGGVRDSFALSHSSLSDLIGGRPVPGLRLVELGPLHVHLLDETDSRSKRGTRGGARHGPRPYHRRQPTNGRLNPLSPLALIPKSGRASRAFVGGRAVPVRLTDRQRECLILARDRTDKEIARHLGISAHTVNKHIAAAMRSFGTSSRREAIRLVLVENPPGELDAIPTSQPLASAPGGEVRPTGADASTTGWRASVLRGPLRSKGSVAPTMLAFTVFGLVALAAVTGIALSIANTLNPISSAHYAQEQKNDRN